MGNVEGGCCSSPKAVVVRQQSGNSGSSDSGGGNTGMTASPAGDSSGPATSSSRGESDNDNSPVVPVMVPTTPEGQSNSDLAAAAAAAATTAAGSSVAPSFERPYAASEPSTSTNQRSEHYQVDPLVPSASATSSNSNSSNSSGNIGGSASDTLPMIMSPTSADRGLDADGVDGDLPSFNDSGGTGHKSSSSGSSSGRDGRSPGSSSSNQGGAPSSLRRSSSSNKSLRESNSMGNSGNIKMSSDKLGTTTTSSSSKNNTRSSGSSSSDMNILPSCVRSSMSHSSEQLPRCPPPPPHLPPSAAGADSEGFQSMLTNAMLLVSGDNNTNDSDLHLPHALPDSPREMSATVMYHSGGGSSDDRSARADDNAVSVAASGDRLPHSDAAGKLSEQLAGSRSGQQSPAQTSRPPSPVPSAMGASSTYAPSDDTDMSLSGSACDVPIWSGSNRVPTVPYRPEQATLTNAARMRPFEFHLDQYRQQQLALKQQRFLEKMNKEQQGGEKRKKGREGSPNSSNSNSNNNNNNNGDDDDEPEEHVPLRAGSCDSEGLNSATLMSPSLSQSSSQSDADRSRSSAETFLLLRPMCASSASSLSGSGSIEMHGDAIGRAHGAATSRDSNLSSPSTGDLLVPPANRSGDTVARNVEEHRQEQPPAAHQQYQHHLIGPADGVVGSSFSLSSLVQGEAPDGSTPTSVGSNNSTIMPNPASADAAAMPLAPLSL